MSPPGPTGRPGARADGAAGRRLAPRRDPIRPVAPVAPRRHRRGRPGDCRRDMPRARPDGRSSRGPQPGCCRVGPPHRLHDVAARRRTVILGLQLPEGAIREKRAGPGAEVLGGEIAAGRLAQVVVHVVRRHVPDLAVVVDIREQVLSRQVLAPADDRREASVTDVHLAYGARLAPKTEPHARPVDPGMSTAHRRQAVRPVEACVLLVPDADQGELEQLHDRGQHLLPG
jgi:hypothetical protein